MGRGGEVRRGEKEGKEGGYKRFLPLRLESCHLDFAAPSDSAALHFLSPPP